MSTRPGPITLFGSGETSPSGRRVYESLFAELAPPARVAVLETPAGFEPNSAQVAGRVGDFIRERLQNYHPEIRVVPARKRGTAFSPDDPAVVAPLLRANVIFLGPGSPTYAARQLADSLAWRYVVARQRAGASLIMASAAIIAVGSYVLPVYEIYKAGADLHWQQGLGLFAPYGLSLAIVSHWDNVEGGAGLDTRRCYMGQARFDELLSLLPADATVLGIDEHTAVVVDLAAETCRVMGRGGATVCRPGAEERFEHGAAFPVRVLGPFRPLPSPDRGIPPEIWEQASGGQGETESPGPPPEVLALVEARTAARGRKDWASADVLRREIAAHGWQVNDTPQGPQVAPLPANPAP